MSTVALLLVLGLMFAALIYLEWHDNNHPGPGAFS